MIRSRFTLLATCIALGGCGIMPRHRLREAAQFVPQMRAFALERLPDLTPQEREAIESREPVVGDANYVIYYFTWSDPSGRPVVTVEASAPPCRPHSVRRHAVDRKGQSGQPPTKMAV
jgi:hypothetical protein